MNGISPWHIERLRLVRTRRMLVLVAVFVFFGLTDPLLARYLGDLLRSSASSGASRITVIVPPPTPADGVSGYQKSAVQIGLIVSVVIAAYACAVDANPALSTFYRSRTRNFRTLILPRVVVTTAGVVGAYVVGMLVAWYETATLIGAPDVQSLLRSTLLGAAYLAFAVAVTALAGTIARNALGTAGTSLLILFLLPVLGTIPAFSRWLPSALASTKLATDFAPRALLVTAVLMAGSLALASVRGDQREVG
jgi:ABC-2 type transport system permease protein